MKARVDVVLHALIVLLSTAALSLAQESPSSTPSAGTISVSGVSAERFNPTHGTAFFRVSGAYFPSDPRDVAVIIDDRQLPAGNLAVSRRIVAASFVMAPGPNTLVLRAWDNSGQVLTSETRLWAGDLTMEVEITDVLGSPVKDGQLTASLATAPSIRSTVAVANGRAELVNLPDEDLLLEASDPSGRRAILTVRAADRRAALVLR